MSVIRKFQLKVMAEQTLKLPLCWQLLCIKAEKGKVYLYAIADPEAVDDARYMEEVTFYMLETGCENSNEILWHHKYLETVSVKGFEWHIFLKDKNYG